MIWECWLLIKFEMKFADSLLFFFEGNTGGYEESPPELAFIDAGKPVVKVVFRASYRWSECK